MSELDRIYGHLTRDLAPGISDRSRVVTDRVLYRSAADARAGRPPVSGDSMETDDGRMQNVLEPERRDRGERTAPSAAGPARPSERGRERGRDDAMTVDRDSGRAAQQEESGPSVGNLGELGGVEAPEEERGRRRRQAPGFAAAADNDSAGRSNGQDLMDIDRVGKQERESDLMTIDREDESGGRNPLDMLRRS